jgi:hypothetical protein
MKRFQYSWVGTALYYGERTTGLSVASAAPQFSGLWRIRYPDGSLSDFTNLTRAKDAASYYHASRSRQDRANRAAEAAHA